MSKKNNSNSEFQLPSVKQSSDITLMALTEPENEDEKGEFGEFFEGEKELTPVSNAIKVGDSLPYGISLYYQTLNKPLRMKDIGEKNRILVVGTIGAFTPDCWNRHLYGVLSKLTYYNERGIDYICCVTTNDIFVNRAWAEFLGCEDEILMWSDPSTKFTKALGMDFVLPWLDDKVRSKRYVILAEDMVVTKMIMAPCDSSHMKWQCEHLQLLDEESSTEEPWSSV